MSMGATEKCEDHERDGPEAEPCDCTAFVARYDNEEDDACPLHGRASHHADRVLG